VIAVTAEAVDRFLRRHLKDEYRPSTPLQRKLESTEVEQQVRPSIVQVLKELR
jgi:hypothetical protein